MIALQYFILTLWLENFFSLWFFLQIELYSAWINRSKSFVYHSYGFTNLTSFYPRNFFFQKQSKPDQVKNIMISYKEMDFIKAKTFQNPKVDQ